MNTIFNRGRIGQVRENKNLHGMNRVVNYAQFQTDKAQKVPLYTEVADGQFKEVRYQGIQNLSTKEIVTTVSPRYSILQHGDAVRMVGTAMAEYGIQAQGNVRNYGDSILLEVLFDNVRFDDDSQGIQFGMKFCNSFSKTNGFNGWAYGLRQICSNGMHLWRVIPNSYISVKHTGDVVRRVGERMRMFVENMAEYHGMMVDIIEAAESDIINFGNDAQLVQSLIPYAGSDRRAKDIIERKGIEVETPRWELYNKFTEYASHEELSFTMEERIHEAAQKILVAPVPIIEVVAN